MSVDMKIVDPHVDVADFYELNKWTAEDFYSDSDVPWATWGKLQQAGIDIIGLTLYFDQSFVTTSFYDGVMKFYNFYQELIGKHPERFQKILSAKDIADKSEDQLGYFYSIEGFECFREPSDFDYFYDLGVRSYGFTWSFENEYASGRHSKKDEGITKLGLEVIRKMNERKNMLVDIAHLSQQSIRDLDKHYEGMIVSTHTNLMSVFSEDHNLLDYEVQMVVDRGGVVSLFPLTADTGEQGTFEELFRHVDYFLNKWGIENLAICSDIYPLPEYPFLENHEDILIMKHLYDYFSTRLSASDLDKMFYSNWVRVLSESL